ncbi:hypothetical protein [Bacillus sp. 1P06AnD]
MKNNQKNEFIYDEKGLEETQRQLQEAYGHEPVKEKRKKSKEK